MKLLLDEMHAAAAARALRTEGFDVVAVAETAELRGLPDDELLEAAARAERALVTENVRDFAVIARAWTAAGRRHAGIIFTSQPRFNRAMRAYPGDLVTGLRAFLERPPIDGDSWTWWL